MVSINLTKIKRAPIAIGRAYISGEDMYMSAMKGRCLTILQIYNDSLWQMGDKSLPIPVIPSVKKELVEKEEEKPIDDELEKNWTI